MKHTISMTYSGWERLKEKIVEDYGPTTVLISWRLREQLGFTVREHYEYNASDKWNPHRPIRLDFWNEQLQTMFLLKYSSYLEDQLTYVEV